MRARFLGKRRGAKHAATKRIAEQVNLIPKPFAEMTLAELLEERSHWQTMIDSRFESEAAKETARRTLDRCNKFIEEIARKNVCGYTR